MALMWAGKLGAGCTGSGCKDCPSPQEPACIECPQCDKRGCERCRYMGWFELACCPRKYVDGWLWEFFRFAELFRRGVPPIAGGALDQEVWFLDACEFLWSEQDHLAPRPMLGL